MSQRLIPKVIPSHARTPEGPVGGPVADLASRRGEEPIDPDDAEAGRWLDGALKLDGGPVPFAERIGVDLAYLRKMRKGQKPIAGRHIVKMKGETEIALGFVAELLESIGYVAVPKSGPTIDEIRDDVLAFVRSEEMLWRLYVQRAERRGWTREQLDNVLVAASK